MSEETKEAAAKRLVELLEKDNDADFAELPGSRRDDLSGRYAYQTGCFKYHLEKALADSPKLRKEIESFLAHKKSTREGGA